MFSWLTYHLRQYFGFSRRETYGTVVMLLLVTCLTFFSPLVRYYRRQQLAQHYEQDKSQLNKLLEEMATTPPKSKPQHTSQQPPAPSSPLDINQAQAAQLEQIPGISSQVARSIIAYRSRLGGFVSAAQYGEIKNLDPQARALLERHTHIAPGYIPQQIPINSADIEVLARHPYLNYAKARTIIAYRLQHGAYRSLQDLERLALLTPQDIQALAPYFVFT